LLGRGFRSAGGLGCGFGAGGGLGLGAGAFFAGALLGGLAKLVLTGELDGALASLLLGARQAAGLRRRRALTAGRSRAARRVVAALGGRRAGEISLRRRMGTRALGLHHHRLGPTVAEALLHRARADRTCAAGLQAQGRASAGGGGSAVVVLVAHALALLSGRADPDQSFQQI